MRTLRFVACLIGSIVIAASRADALDFPVGHSSVADAQITRLMMDEAYPQIVFLQLSDAPDENAECHRNSTWHYAIPISSPEGQNMYSALLALKASAGHAFFGGADECVTELPPEILGIERLARLELH
ncbi:MULTISPECIES: hypothetical protein [Aliagarivorans]|uniref:hypothetical protein n=1 Tax=Aliagarivorans TaxID=882379 RepID=UPI00047EA10D|nr:MULTISPECIES: hypothetical protein [Aliagarivorans]